MPTKTFLNLPEEKQMLLLEAAKREFSRASFHDASINQMIQDAKIPRGSFYMYFEDKEDIYFYLLGQYRKDLYQRFLERLKEEQGDFITCFEKLYDEIVEYCSKEETTSFFKNVFLNMRYTTEKKVWLKPDDKEMKESKTELFAILDKSKFTSQSDEDLEDSISLVMMITTGSLAYVFMNHEEAEKEKEIYHRRLAKLKYGLYKREETTK